MCLSAVCRAGRNVPRKVPWSLVLAKSGEAELPTHEATCLGSPGAEDRARVRAPVCGPGELSWVCPAQGTGRQPGKACSESVIPRNLGLGQGQKGHNRASE